MNDIYILTNIKNLFVNIYDSVWVFMQYRVNLKDKLRIPKHLYQRMRYNFSDRDTWNMDVNLSRSLGRALLMMSKNTPAFPGRDPYDTADKWVNDLHTHGASLVKYSHISSNGLNLNEEDLENARLALAWVGKYLPMLWD